jgi:hypothetical protein
MPANTPHQTLYIGAQTIPLLNVSSLYKPGELGMRIIDTGGREYQTVQCDSGPTSVAAGDVAFWMSKSTYKVTNKLADAPQGRNGIAGVFLTTVTPGYYCRIQIGGSSYTNVKTSGAPNQGMIAVANSGTGSDVVGIPAGTAPTYVPLGVFAGEPSTGKTAVSITIGAMSVTP